MCRLERLLAFIDNCMPIVVLNMSMHNKLKLPTGFFPKYSKFL